MVVLVIAGMVYEESRLQRFGDEKFWIDYPLSSCSEALCWLVLDSCSEAVAQEHILIVLPRSS